MGSLSKISSLSLNQGRGLVVSKDSSQFFFIMGDIAINGKGIGYEDFPEELIIKEKKELNNYLVTESFQFNDSDELLLSLYLGVADSTVASSLLAKDKTLSFHLS